MSTVAPRATGITTSIPTTQPAVAVERAIMSSQQNEGAPTRATPPVIEARVRLQTIAWP